MIPFPCIAAQHTINSGKALQSTTLVLPGVARCCLRSDTSSVMIDFGDLA